MDGYAVRVADVLGATPGAPHALRVAGRGLRGRARAERVTAGVAVRIATGAPLPGGADAVVRVEDTRPGASADEVLVADDRDARDEGPGGGAARRNVRPAGEDVRAGTAPSRSARA
jgi:molybdopterin molybdotransferase